MTKKELIARVANDVGLTQIDAAAALQSFLINITEAVTGEDGKIVLPGFGTFEKIYRGARKCRNPRTGEQMLVAAKHTVKFRPGKQLKETVSA